MEKKSLNASQKMKKTQVGEIPVDWSVVTIEKICDNVKDKVNSQFYPYIEIGDIDISRKNYLIKDKSSPIGAKLAKKGDIIISTVRPDRGAISKVRHDTAVSSAFVVLRDKGISDWEYVYQVLSQKKFFTRLGLLSTGSTYPTCDGSDILDFKFGLPTLLEQRKIAEILASIDLVIDYTQAVIDQTQTLKKGLMQELFSRGLPGRHKKFKKTEIGKIPDEWKLVRLGEIFKLTSGDGISVRLLTPNYSKDTPYQVYGGNGIAGFTSRYLIEKPVIVIGRVGEYCGVVYLTEGKAWISDNALYTKEFYIPINLQFLKQKLISENIPKLRSKSGQPLVSQKPLHNYKIALPLKNEQDEISDTLIKIETKEQKENEFLDHTKILKSALMQVLLTGKVRVER